MWDGISVVLQFLFGMPSGIGLKLKQGTSKLLHLEHSIVGCLILDMSESRTEITGNVLSVVLKKDGEDQLDRSCEK